MADIVTVLALFAVAILCAVYGARQYKRQIPPPPPRPIKMRKDDPQ